jgi:hypothetical protein
MDRSGHVGGRTQPPWWDFTRQIIMFLTGLGILLYAVVTKGHDIPFIVAGLILIGIVPIDQWLIRRANDHNGANSSSSL